jgi:hypothetical protein
MKKLILPALLLLGLTACGGGGGGGTDAFCDQARVTDSIGDDFGNLAEDATPDEVRAAIDRFVEAADKARAAAPAEIEDTLTTITGGLKDVRDVLRDNGFDMQKTFEDEDFSKLADDEGLSKASDELDAYLQKTCGITPETDPADTAVPETAPVDTAATADTAPAGQDGLAGQLADEFAAGAGIELTAEQRQCVGQGLLDDIGLETLASLADAQDLDAGTLSKVLDVLDRCGVAIPAS